MTTERKRQLTIIFLVFLTVLVADQLTKELVLRNIIHNSVGFKPNTFFWITHARNEGLVNSMFDGVRPVTLVAPLIAMGVLFYLYRFLNPASRLQAISFAMVAGGAIGNYIDRVRLGSVTDFLQFHFYFIPFNFPWKYFPPFNIADSCICVGVVVLVIMLQIMEASKQKAETIAAGQPKADPKGSDK
jgi:signal peptidase II